MPNNCFFFFLSLCKSVVFSPSIWFPTLQTCVGTGWPRGHWRSSLRKKKSTKGEDEKRKREILEEKTAIDLIWGEGSSFCALDQKKRNEKVQLCESVYLSLTCVPAFPCLECAGSHNSRIDPENIWNCWNVSLRQIQAVLESSSPGVAGLCFLRAPPEEHLSAQNKHFHFQRINTGSMNILIKDTTFKKIFSNAVVEVNIQITKVQRNNNKNSNNRIQSMQQ